MTISAYLSDAHLPLSDRVLILSITGPAQDRRRIVTIPVRRVLEHDGLMIQDNGLYLGQEFNPGRNLFDVGSVELLLQLVVDQVHREHDDVDGDWKERAISFVEGLLKPLVFLRDRYGLLLDVEVIRNYFNLESLVALLMDNMMKVKNDFGAELWHERPDAKYPGIGMALSGLAAYIDNLPSFNFSKPVNKQESVVSKQHGYITMQLIRTFNSLAETCGHANHQDRCLAQLGSKEEADQLMAALMDLLTATHSPSLASAAATTINLPQPERIGRFKRLVHALRARWQGWSLPKRSFAILAVIAGVTILFWSDSPESQGQPLSISSNRGGGLPSTGDPLMAQFEQANAPAAGAKGASADKTAGIKPEASGALRFGTPPSGGDYKFRPKLERPTVTAPALQCDS